MDALRARYEAITTDASTEQRALTAQALVRRQYMPMTILSVPNFFSFTKEDMLKEFDRVAALPEASEELRSVIALDDAGEIKKKHLTVLLNQYELLCALRRNDPEAWALINELYEDD